MNHRDIVEAYGYKILPRASFLNATANLIEGCGIDHDGQLFKALKARASKIDGAFVLYDPEDSDEGWLLIGNDADELARETVALLDLRNVA